MLRAVGKLIHLSGCNIQNNLLRPRLLGTATTTAGDSTQAAEHNQPPADTSAIIKPLEECASTPDKLYTRLEIEIRSAEPAVLKSYSWFATTAAQHLGIEVGRCWAERKPQHDRLTLLKSVHIYKKHRVQYEIRTYFRHMHFHKLTGSTLDTFLEYIERNLPEGVGIKSTKVAIEKMPEHLREPPKF